MRAPVRAVVGLAAVAVGLAGCTGAGAGPGPDPGSPPEPAPAIRLVAFDSCGSALRELTRAADPYVGPYGLPAPGVWDARARTGVPDSVAAGDAAAAPSAPQPPPAHSTTTAHEAGVDEPDVVKTDGRRIVSVLGDRLRVVDLADRRVTTVPGLPSGPMSQLLLHGDRALVVVPYGGGDRAGGPAGARFVLVDLTGAGRVLETLTVDGAYVDGRQVGGVARLVVRSGPRLTFVQPRERLSPDAAQRENRRIVARSAIDDWLPRYQLRRRRHPAAGPAGGLRPGQPPGGVLRCLDAHRADRRPGRPARHRRPGRRRGRRRRGLRHRHQPVRGRPGVAGHGRRPAPRAGAAPGPAAAHRGAQVRPARGRPAAVRRVRVGVRLAAQPVRAVRARRPAAGGDHARLGNGRDTCCDGPPRTESAVTVLAAAGRPAGPGRPARRPGQGRADLRGPLRRAGRLRGHLPADRPAVHSGPAATRRGRGRWAS